jgi:hypothetical protein
MARTISDGLLKNLLENLNDSLAPQKVVHIDDTNRHIGPFFAITALADAVVDVSECDTGIIERSGAGTTAAIATDFTIPKGVTIYGTFDSLELDSGSVLAYARKGITITVD